eukprot:TRINITY_DN7670_c0_g1_i1.p1 TRINITY_DN7670_c0_g1~~TRINITY_DN7670_c0_g1_i1.p1  ORF type:complete len:252 (+),score=41.03 TRINITY_DN7670_c0_g1_i1:27-758(+)
MLRFGPFRSVCTARRASCHSIAAGAKPRLLPCTPAGGMTQEQKTLYDRILEDRGKTGAKGGFPITNNDGSLVGPWNAMVSSPLIGGLAERMGSFCRHRNACAMDLYEVGILVVGQTRMDPPAGKQSHLEDPHRYAHEKLALKAGVTPEAIQGIKERLAPESVSGMTDAQRAVYAYARELHDTKRVSQETHATALGAVGSEQALVDLIFTMGFYHQISMVLNALDVPLPPGEAPPFEEPAATKT